MELKGVIGSGVETTEGWAESNERRERKSLRNEVHHADAVVRGPV